MLQMRSQRSAIARSIASVNHSLRRDEPHADVVLTRVLAAPAGIRTARASSVQRLVSEQAGRYSRMNRTVRQHSCRKAGLPSRNAGLRAVVRVTAAASPQGGRSMVDSKGNTRAQSSVLLDGPSRAPARSMLHAIGFSEEDL